MGESAIAEIQASAAAQDRQVRMPQKNSSTSPEAAAAVRAAAVDRAAAARVEPAALAVAAAVVVLPEPGLRPSPQATCSAVTAVVAVTEETEAMAVTGDVAVTEALEVLAAVVSKSSHSVACRLQMISTAMASAPDSKSVAAMDRFRTTPTRTQDATQVRMLACIRDGKTAGRLELAARVLLSDPGDNLGGQAAEEATAAGAREEATVVPAVQEAKAREAQAGPSS